MRPHGLACRTPARADGLTLVEVLVTMVILAFGLLGIAALQAKMQVGTIESYQRAQAIVLLEDMSARMTANRSAAASYVQSAPVGTGDSQPADCSALASGAPHDVCEWSNALKGAAEQKDGALVGAMVDARGCIDQVQAPDATSGVCRPGIYQLTVTWQGLHETTASPLACARNLYGNDGNRRAIVTRVSVGLPGCS